MCGRYTLKTSPELLAAAFGLDEVPTWAPRYNVAPSQQGLIVVPGPPRRARAMRWGLQTPWSAADGGSAVRTKQARIAPPINARAETIASKPMFREAFRARRGLCLVDGFYEWRPARGLDLFGQPYDVAGARSQPLYIQRADGEPFAIAAIWDGYAGSEGPVETFAVVTTAANALMRTIHDRMPVILPGAAIDAWLGGDLAEAADAMRPLADGVLVARPVSSLVNATRHEGPALLEP